jgi:hypothetical protein
MFFDYVDDAASIQGPKAKVRDQDCYRCTCLNWRIGPAQMDPWHIEHTPLRNGLHRSREDNIALA